MLKRRTPLKSKRNKPRRNEGRVTQLRIKDTATGKTAEEDRFIKLVKSLGCLICGAKADGHHIMHAPGKHKRRDHRFVCPLCPLHHNLGNNSVHLLGSESKFYEHWGVDLVGWAVTAWSYRDHPDAQFWTYSVTRWRAVARSREIGRKGGLVSAVLDDTRSNQP